jgi:hypothetical protein
MGDTHAMMITHTITTTTTCTTGHTTTNDDGTLGTGNGIMDRGPVTQINA